MVTNGIINSVCDICSQYCGVLIRINNGRVIEIKGNPDSPINKGNMCPKGKAALEFLYHRDRLKYPLKRAGKRGEGRWQQISWDEALDTIINEWAKVKDKYGVESIAFIRGARKGLQDDCMRRFTTLLGTPNDANASYVCWVPRQFGEEVTLGYKVHPDYDYPPALIVNWGCGVSESRPGEYWRMLPALDSGIKLVVIDPRRTRLAQRANLWLQPRPGSDMALALGLINVIVNEDLYDKPFVDEWTIGFDQLKAHIHDYTPENVAKITWVPADKIREAAKLYANTKPAAIQDGNANSEHNVNSFQAARAISILKAITGNLGVPGGDIKYDMSQMPKVAINVPSNKTEKPIKPQRPRLGSESMIPMAFWASIPVIVRAILDEDPYPVRAMYVQSTNPVLTWPNTKETVKALKSLDFLAVAEMWLTPTAALADIVLPVAGTYFEFDSVMLSNYIPCAQVQQKVTQIGECRPDFEIQLELAKRLGFVDRFWKNMSEFLNEVMRPTGLTFDEFRKVGVICAPKLYRDYRTNSFGTPSKKVELYSSRLKEWGFAPLPVFHEPPETPFSEPELTKEYPLILTSGKTIAYRHSQGRQINSIRGGHPDPMVVIHPETASELGIKEGDWVYIETKRGRIRQKAILSSEVTPPVIYADYGFWFPEKGASELYGALESNINVLTDNSLSSLSREMQTANLRGMCCKVYKVSS